jgi:hypothetical protein
MKTTWIRTTVLVAGLALAPLQAAFAISIGNNEPSGDERALIAEALLDQGYVSWGKVKFDDGVWEVDDARTVENRKVDLKLDRSLNVIDVDD